MFMISNLKDAIWRNMLYNTEEAKPYLSILGWILIVTYIGFYFFNSIIAVPGGYENIPLRLMISVFGFLLIFYNYLPSIIIKIFTALFYLILLISFPFFFTYMMLNNLESNVWQVKGLVGLVLLSFFVDWRSFIILATLGVGLAFIFVHNGSLIIDEGLVGVFGSYSAPVIYLLIFSKKKHALQEERNDYHSKIRELNDSLEQKVLERTKALQKALSAKTEFLNNMSHEIRTPVHGFTAISEGLVDHWNGLEEAKKYKYVKTIAENAKRLENLINSLLDMSKFNADKMQMDFREINLDQLVKNIIAECNALYLAHKYINISYISSGEIFIIADQERIEQVLRNLFFNAIKFTPDGGDIKAIIKADETMVCFSLEDSGIGVPEEELTEIFEAFTQSSRTKSKAGGTGLGLGIAKKIIDAHYGKIWAANNEIQGSTFSFTVPLAPEKRRDIITSRQSINVLMIDDDQVCLAGAEILLSGTNFNLIPALDGKTGISYLKTYSPIDVILLDLMMPEIDGIGVLIEINKDPKLSSIPVILQSGASDEGKIEEAYKLGVYSFLKKPYDKEKLLAELNKVF